MEAMKLNNRQYETGQISRAQFEAKRDEILDQISGEPTKLNNPESFPTTLPSLNQPRVVRYVQVAPKTETNPDRWGQFPGNVMEKGQRPEDPFTLEHNPHYPVGANKAGLGECDQLQSFLDDLEEKLARVEDLRLVVQKQLPRGLMLGKPPRNGINEAKPAEKVKPSMMMVYAKNNDVKNMEVLLKMGVAVDYRDEDTGNTPLMVACQAGQRQAMFYLVEQGANVNAQNIYGASPLHELIKNKRENLAIWLVKHGADIYLEDKRTYTPFDLALPWFQEDLKKCAAGVDTSLRYEVTDETTSTYTLTRNQIDDKPKGVQTSLPIRIFLQNDSFKTLFVEPDWTARIVIQKMCEKIGMEAAAKHFQLLERVQGKERKVDLDANVIQTQKKWPEIYGPNGNETNTKCKFVVIPNTNAPKSVVDDYQVSLECTVSN